MLALAFHRFPTARYCTLALLLLVLAGCDGAPEVSHPVVGEVLLNGKPWTGGGTVLLEPLDSGGGARYAARGRIDPNGQFALSTFGEGDGAVAGRYRVLVQPSAAGHGDNPSSQGRPFPARYSSPTQSDLQFEVTPGRNTLPIAMHTDGPA